jgi:isoleucyl-tRNA synthetase
MRMQEVILEEINVKSIEYVTDESGLVRKKARPNFKSLGPKFGKAVQQVAARIKELTLQEIAALETSGTLTFEAGGEPRAIVRGDVEILREDMPGWLVESDGSLTVALDTALDDALIAEGLAREFVNRVQNMRKDAGFAVTDRIGIFLDAPAPAGTMLDSMRGYIQTETLAVEFSPVYRDGEYASTAELNGVTVRVGIERRPERG